MDPQAIQTDIVTSSGTKTSEKVTGEQVAGEQGEQGEQITGGKDKNNSGQYQFYSIFRDEIGLNKKRPNQCRLVHYTGFFGLVGASQKTFVPLRTKTSVKHCYLLTRYKIFQKFSSPQVLN